MHKVYFSKVLGTMVQVDAEDGWATAYTAAGISPGWLCDIYVRGDKFVYAGNGNLGREVVEEAPEVMREAFLPVMRKELQQANEELANASMKQNAAALRVKRFETLGVDTENHS